MDSQSEVFSDPVAGEICVMLLASAPHSGIRKLQDRLVERYGGEAVTGLHLTLQRLTPPPGRSDPQMVGEIREAMTKVGPLRVRGTDAFLMYSSFRGAAIIKVRVEHEPGVSQRIERFSEELRDLGYETKYPFVSSLVTFLAGIVPGVHPDGEAVAVPEEAGSWVDVRLDLDTAGVARLAGQNSGEGMAEWRLDGSATP